MKQTTVFLFLMVLLGTSYSIHGQDLAGWTYAGKVWTAEPTDPADSMMLYIEFKGDSARALFYTADSILQYDGAGTLRRRKNISLHFEDEGQNISGTLQGKIKKDQLRGKISWDFAQSPSDNHTGIFVMERTIMPYGIIRDRKIKEKMMAQIASQNPFAEPATAPATPQKSGITTVEWEENRWDFMEIDSGAVVSHTYWFKNTGNEPYTITRVKPTCGCTSPDWSKEPVMPGKRGFVTLSFNSAHKKGEVQKAATVSGNSEPPRKILSFKANIRPGPGQP